MAISRRNLLLGIAAAGAGVAGTIGLRFAISRPEHVIVDIINNQLGYLKLDPEGVQAFAAELVKKNWIATTKLKLFSATGMLLMPFRALGFNPMSLQRGQERVVTYYLLSTDFFLTGADVTRTVSYLGFYDPYKAACLNPFPRTVQDTVQTGA